jgi:ABC-type multidrug transport system ATPase subunit
MSVALSTIGEPKVILMDEPTTGMDPVSRRQVWDLIQNMKKGRVIVMTTHAMEEAELLSDKLAVLNHGEVACVGTPLQLKNLLGKGYRVSLVCNKKNINQVKALVK